jgi:probable rRNA maturation factor
MIKVLIKKQSHYPISNWKIRKTLQEFFKSHGIVSDSLVEVSLVGEKAMVELARRHLGEKDMVHDVLSFPESEVRGEFIYPDDGFIRLGEIVLCYPKIFKEAKDEGVLIEQKALELIRHSAMHLLGFHHE